MLDGLLGLALESGVALAGGNITRSPGPLVIDVTVIGSVKPRRVLTRGGGRAGDGVYVTGLVGAAAAGLGWLRARTSEDAPRFDRATRVWPSASRGIAGPSRARASARSSAGTAPQAPVWI